jgi:PII-like signaling protein
MNLPEDGCLLRIFVGESDRHGGKPLYEWLLLEARRGRPRGRNGAARHRGVRCAQPAAHGEDPPVVGGLPMVVEIVDSRDKVEAFLARVEPAIQEGLARSSARRFGSTAAAPEPPADRRGG